MRRIWLAGILAAGALTLWAQDDPPSRVARLNYLDGSVSMQQSGQTDWSPAAPNYPMTIGDHLWADQGSRAELHIGSTAIRVSHDTALTFLNLDDHITQVQLSAGTLNVTVRNLDEGESYEIDTPNSAVSLLRPGVYRISADPDQQTTLVTVRAGDAEVTALDALAVHAQQTAVITGTGDQSAMQTRAADPTDDFDRWWMDRDARFVRRPPPRYVSPDMIGYEDLDDNGTWRDMPGYGAVWYPNAVAAGWAPYHNGHWAWVEPWGWTWIDDAPWGFAPFHYGRWAFIAGTWGWVPGPVYARPVYAPALVAWVGGGGFGAGVSFGAGGGVAWIPLGPREPFIPAYHVSNVYVNRVNMVEVTHINVTNVTNITYVNRTVPGAVVAVSRTDFAAARPVARVAVAVPPQAVARASFSTRDVVVTKQEAVAVRPTAPVRVARPPQAVVNRVVVTKTPPPAATRALARPAAAQTSRPSAPNQPPAAARPVAPQTPVNRPQPQPAPAYKPPVQQAEPSRPPQQQAPANRPQAQPAPAYKPPVEQAEPSRPSQQQAPATRPAQQTESYKPPPKEPQAKPQNTPAYRPPAAQQQQRPQAAPAEKAKPETKPEAKPKGKEKEKEKEK